MLQVWQATDNKYSEKRPEAWLRTKENYPISRCFELDIWLKLAEAQLWTTITSEMVGELEFGDACSDASPTVTSARPWGDLNLVLEDRMVMSTLNYCEQLNGSEARRHAVVHLQPRPDAKRVDSHTTVHNRPRSKSLREMASDAGAREKRVNEFEACAGTILELDKRTVLSR